MPLANAARFEPGLTPRGATDERRSVGVSGSVDSEDGGDVERFVVGPNPTVYNWQGRIET
jgi:hypothetical protein